MADEEKIQIYHNAMCSKSREGMCMLEELGDEVEIVEYTKNPLTEEQLSELIAKLEMRPKQWIKAMIKYPELMERPIVVKGNKAVIGRPPTLITELIQS